MGRIITIAILSMLVTLTSCNPVGNPPAALNHERTLAACIEQLGDIPPFGGPWICCAQRSTGRAFDRLDTDRLTWEGYDPELRKCKEDMTKADWERIEQRELRQLGTL